METGIKWRQVGDYIVCVEDGIVTKGIEVLPGDKYRAVYPYKHGYYGFSSNVRVTLDSFRDGMREGRYYMRPKGENY